MTSISILDTFNPALVAFDKDGTLIDFHAMWGGWTRELGGRLEAATGLPASGPLLRRYGYDAPDGQAGADAVISFTPMGELREIAGLALMDCGCAPENVEAALAAAWHVPDPVRLAQPLADLPALFGQLRARGAKVAVITGDDRVPTLATLEAFNVMHLVDGVSCGDDGLPTKPWPDALINLCRGLDIPLERTMVVGDTAADMKMGRTAGAGLTVGVLSGASPSEVLAPHADFLLASIAELA